MQAADEESDEGDDFIYNPLKLPMGWDGKPIPYWLYKLHGLNQVGRLISSLQAGRHSTSFRIPPDRYWPRLCFHADDTTH